MGQCGLPRGVDKSTRIAIQKFAQKFRKDSTPEFTSVTLTGLTASRLIWTNASKTLASKDLVDLVAGTTNQVTVADDSAGGVTLSLPQNIHTGASPTFAGGTFTGVVTGISPTLAAHLATKEYVDLSVGTQIDFFFSDTASGVGSNYLMYPIETGDGSSTLNSSALGQGDDQLCFSFLTEAGQPGVNYLREGVYSIHTHLNNGVGQKSTAIYATISYVDSDGSSNETLVATSEVTSAITSSETSYDIHAAISTDVNIDTTKRVLVKFFANVGATGTNSTVTITMEGTTDSHISLATSSEIYQRQGAVLDDLNTVGIVTGDDYMLVGTAAGVFAWETGATLRTSIGVDAAGTAAAAVATHESTYNHANYNTAYTHSTVTTGNPHSVTKSEVGLGDVENTALSTWAGTTNIVTVGTIGTGTWNATAIGIAKGGTGQVTAQAAIDALTNVAAATNEHVLTKDTVTGSAIWKAATGGSDAFTVKVDAAATADYIGAASSDGVLRTTTGLSYTDGGNYVTLGLSHLGIQSLSDPNDDRILFWDDSETATGWLDIGTGLNITTTTLSNTGILGDGTAGRVLRQIQLKVENGTNANTVKCTVSSIWNGDTIAVTDNISKGATTGNFYLTGSGQGLRILYTGLSGDPLFGFTNIVYHDASSSYNPIFVTAQIESEPSIEVAARKASDGTGIDWTAMMDDGSITSTNVNILYLTDA